VALPVKDAAASHLGWTPLVSGVSLARNWAVVGKLV
jgi:hypothetical protein